MLLVDDDPADQDLMRRSLARSEYGTRLEVFDDGERALDRLLGRGPFVGRSDLDSPDLVFLDLNMPRLGGIELLRAIRSNPELCGLVTIVLSTSSCENDIRDSYAAGANAFVEKAEDLAALDRVLRRLEQFWFGAVELPTVRRQRSRLS